MEADLLRESGLQQSKKETTKTKLVGFQEPHIHPPPCECNLHVRCVV